MTLARLVAATGAALLIAAPVLAQEETATPPQTPSEEVQPPGRDTPPLPEAPMAAPAAEDAPPATDSTTGTMYSSPPAAPAAAPVGDASTWKAGDPGITSNQPVPNPPAKPRRNER